MSDYRSVGKFTKSIRKNWSCPNFFKRFTSRIALFSAMDLFYNKIEARKYSLKPDV